MGPLEAFDTLVTDAKPEAKFIDWARESGVTLLW
jgi:DeoR family deoxyribose operon repressor